jgi:S1-C subfamily serine protease
MGQSENWPSGQVFLVWLRLKMKVHKIGTRYRLGALMQNTRRQRCGIHVFKAAGVFLCLTVLAVLVTLSSLAQTQAVRVSSKSANTSTTSTSAAAAICPIVYPVDQNPSAHGYQYAFYGNAFFINRDGYLITAAHVLHSFRNGGEPHILVQRAEAPPQMLKAEVVLEDRGHDVAVLRATPNPFAGTAYRVSTLAPDATPVSRGEAIVVAALRPKRRQPHSFETELEDRSAASVIDFQNSVLEKGFGDTELLLFNHEVILGQSGAPVLSAGSHEVVAFIDGQWLRPAAGLAVEMKRGEEAHSVGAAVPIRYAVAAVRAKGIGWGSEIEERSSKLENRDRNR